MQKYKNKTILHHIKFGCRDILILQQKRLGGINMAKNYSLPIIKRENILEELESKINSEWSIRIKGIDFNLIKQWKNQFISQS